MPRYFFHIKDKAQEIRDEERIELDDLDEVREEAAESARLILTQQALYGQAQDGRAFVVTDEQGHVVLNFPFKLAIGD